MEEEGGMEKESEKKRARKKGQKKKIPSEHNRIQLTSDRTDVGDDHDRVVGSKLCTCPP